MVFKIGSDWSVFKIIAYDFKKPCTMVSDFHYKNMITNQVLGL